MNLSDMLVAISGEYGALGILLILVLLLVNGRIVPKGYVDDVKATNRALITALQHQSDSLKVLTESSKEALETSKATMKIITEVRKSSVGTSGDASNDM